MSLSPSPPVGEEENALCPHFEHVRLQTAILHGD